MAIIEAIVFLLVDIFAILGVVVLCGCLDIKEALETLGFAVLGSLLVLLAPLGYLAYFILRVAASSISFCLILFIFFCILILCAVYHSIARIVQSVFSLKNYAPVVLRTPRYRRTHGASSIPVPQVMGHGEREPLLPTSDTTQRCLTGCQRELGSCLCAVCDTMIDASSLLVGTGWIWTRLVEEHPHHSSIEDLWQSSTHCALCQLLVRSLQVQHSRAQCNVLDNPILPSYVVKVREIAEPPGGSSLKIQLVVDGMEMRSLVVSQSSKRLPLGLYPLMDPD